MTSLYLDQHGAHLGFQHNQLVLTAPDGAATRFPIHQVERVLVSGAVHFSHAALRALMRQGIPTVFCGSRSGFQGHLASGVGGQVRRRARQYRIMADPAQALAVARRVVGAKHRSQCRLLHQWGMPVGPLGDLGHALDRCHSLDALRGLEGAMARAYFDGLRQRLRGGALTFNRRLHHPPPDPVNALLSLGYTLLTGEAVLALETVGLDRYAGFLHVPDGHRPALALDFIEPFRVLVDRLAAVLAETLTPEDFETTEHGVRCRDGRRGLVYQAWEGLLAREIEWRGMAYHYRTLIHEQAVCWARWLDESEPELHLWSLP